MIELLTPRMSATGCPPRELFRVIADQGYRAIGLEYNDTPLDNQHPQEHWRQYLLPDGPDWSRIVVCGLSQGAGMAAYLAKLKPVARVVLFSGPWDYAGRSP